MSPQIQEFVSTYVKALDESNAAIFAGAGLSQPAGFVNWKELLRSIAAELSLDVDKEHDLISVAQYHKNERGSRAKLNQLLIEEFTSTASATENHKILCRLPIDAYWTTNYDRLIERSLEAVGKTPDVKITPENLAHNVPKRDAIVYKMHGDVGHPDKAVLTKDDYESYNSARQLFTTKLQGDLISKTFLFIGFSFDDPNLEYILSRIRLLLGENQRPHYCFFKRAIRSDFGSDAEFHYAQIKQELRVKDLRRFSINALLVDSYGEITATLREVEKRFRRMRVFISGSCVEFDPWTPDEGTKFVNLLTKKFLRNGFRIVSGFGVNIGTAVINGALEFIHTTNYRHIDDRLILRPFPQFPPAGKTLAECWTEYRQNLVSEIGIAIFLFGNKKDETGRTVPSDGMLEEFELCKAAGVLPIPVGVTGNVSQTLATEVLKNFNAIFPEWPDIEPLLRETTTEKNIDRLSDQIIKIAKRIKGV